MSSYNQSIQNQRRVPTASGIFVLVFVVVLFTGCITAPVGDFRGSDAPVLSWPGDPATTMAISWFGAPEVDGIELRSTSVDVTFVGAERLGAVTRVSLYGLEAGSAYSYRTVLGSEPSGAVWRSFTTAPVAGSFSGAAAASASGSELFEFAVAGDLQPFNDETVRTTTMALAKIGSLHPAFILQVGDVSEVGISYRSWTVAASVLSTAGAAVPFIVAAGNHDYYYGIPSVRNFKTFFPAPYARGDNLRKNTWYSHTVGPVHIAVLDTEAGGDDFQEQINWLEADLAAARSSGTRWIFVAMHRPILATATSGENPQWAPALFPLFARYSVDAVFWGHDHMYEHYEYEYGANGYLFDPADPVAQSSTHLYTVGTAGARVDNLYAGFFSHKPFRESREMYEVSTGNLVTFDFIQRPWNPAHVLREQPGVRYQDPAEYPEAASYYSYPFDNGADAQAGRYSTNPDQRYSDDAEFFGYTYGETSIHYLWVEVYPDRCIITAHYVDGSAGAQGEVITSPDGRQERWVLE